MAKRTAPPATVKPGVYTGKHPDTGVIHRLTVSGDGRIKIERKPYVSALDGWTVRYETLTCEVSKHEFLLLKIKQNPCEWE